MIFWRSDREDLKRYGDIAIAVTGVFVLIAGIFAFTHLDEPPNISTTPFTLPPATTTTTAYVAPPTTVFVPATSSAIATTTVTTLPPDTTTTVESSTTTSSTVAATTTTSSPGDKTAPTIGALVSAPSVFYEAPCGTSVRLSVSITDSSGVLSAKMFGTTMTRFFGTTTWSLVRQASAGLVPEGQNSISLSVPIVAIDTSGNLRSVTKSLVVQKCTT